MIISFMLILCIEPINTSKLQLEPLSINHAKEAAITFADPKLHKFIGGKPATVTELSKRYAKLESGHSLDGKQLWFNWMLRNTMSKNLVGTVQATVENPKNANVYATIAWVVGKQFQNKGYAKEATQAMVVWLKNKNINTLQAFIHPNNKASETIAKYVGLQKTETTHEGEFLWKN